MDKQQIPDKIIPFVWFFIKKYKISFSLMIFITMFVKEVGYFFMMPLLLKYLVDNITNNGFTMGGGLFIIDLVHK